MEMDSETFIELIFGIVGVFLTIIFAYVIYRMVRASKVEEQQLAEKEKAQKVAAPASDDMGILSHMDSTGQVVSDLSIPESAALTEKDVDLRDALKKTEENIFGRIKSLFKTDAKNKHLEEIEEILYTSDLGPGTVQRLMEALQESLSKKEQGDYDLVRSTLKNEIVNIFKESHTSAINEHSVLSKIHFVDGGPTVIMIVGVNGAGKTTSIGKISSQLAQQGKKVLVAAGDTFRAAAENQLKVWTDRAQVEIFSPAGVSDPSAVAFDAVAKAKAQGYDVVIVDTAGRLHTQANLMEEIKKMKRVMAKVIPEAPHETLIVLDANSGQNALMQAREFHNALQLTGAILTKMDGTAKGGVAVGLAQELKIPIKMIGVGERLQDLRAFSAQEFVSSLFQ